MGEPGTLSNPARAPRVRDALSRHQPCIAMKLSMRAVPEHPSEPRIERARRHAPALVVASLLLGGCVLAGGEGEPPATNRTDFNDEVYPVLLRDCGFPECHGALSADEARFFRVYGPGRSRLDPATDPLAPYTPEEREFTYERARSMLASATRAEDTLLVRKPLAVEAGGAAHRGRGESGEDVYLTTDAPGYQALLRWAETAYPPGAP